MLSGALLPFLCGGCSGINTSQSVSPATFFLPGLLKAGPPAPAPNPADPAPPQDNLLAQAR